MSLFWAHRPATPQAPALRGLRAGLVVMLLGERKVKRLSAWKIFCGHPRYQANEIYRLVDTVSSTCRYVLSLFLYSSSLFMYESSFFSLSSRLGLLSFLGISFFASSAARRLRCRPYSVLPRTMRKISRRATAIEMAIIMTV